jgi:hypothetical protein
MDKWLYALLKNALLVASPELVASLREAVANLSDRAKKTANPWDDALMGFLQMIVGKPSVKG